MWVAWEGGGDKRASPGGGPQGGGGKQFPSGSEEARGVRGGEPVVIVRVGLDLSVEDSMENGEEDPRLGLG